VARPTVRMNTEARKQEIVRATLETIAEHGVAGATIFRIAKGAGITSAALYSHFENRRAILLAALDVVYEQVFASFRSSCSRDPIQRLREICENHADKVRDEDKTSHSHLFLEFVASAPEEGFREALREKELAAASYLASIIDEFKQQGSLGRDVDPELTAWLVAGWAWTGDVASLMGVASTWYERVSPRLLDFILGSLSTGNTVEAGDSQFPALEGATVDGLPEGAVFTLEEAAHILRISPDLIRELVAANQIGSLRFGDETRISRRTLVACLRGVSPEELDDYLERRARHACEASGKGVARRPDSARQDKQK
jgi:excisionase family DNA binding protein